MSPRRALLLTAAALAAGASLPQQHARALQFLQRNQPSIDRGVVTDAQLSADVDLALKAREASAWAREVPWEIFANDVLPYACCDEPRCDWRPLLYARCAPLVAGASSTAEAALALNDRLWSELGVAYAPNLSPQILSPFEVIENGKASCSGLSLLLVAACRSVGVPARLAGVNAWDDADGGGNHAWVEVWTDGGWSHLGAAEPTPLNCTWFDERVRRPLGPPIYATTFARQGEVADGGEGASSAHGGGGGAESSRVTWGVPGGEMGMPALDVTAAYRGRREV